MLIFEKHTENKNSEHEGIQRMNDLSRRNFIASTGLGLAGLAAGGALLSPRQAHAVSLPLKILTKVQALTLGALGEALVPGALEAGIIQYVDKQLGEANTLLMLKYLGVDTSNMPDFYSSSLDSAHSLSQHLFNKSPEVLTAGQAHVWAGSIAADADQEWQGPPAGFFFFVARADACDVVFGSSAGSEALNIPYMAHIAPTASW
jgi:hypothetical protein